MTINVTAPDRVTATQSSTPVTVDLFNRFDDPFTTGLVARFELFDTSLAGGITNVVLFDQEGQGAPLTVQNFRDYVNDGAYRNSIIHRSVPGFVVQGGGFTTTDISSVDEVETNDPVRNEFRSDRSNTRGTIAMAKLGGDPNSATSQWFFNLADNSSNLDRQNGGFTVFGEVLSDDDLAVVDAIAALPVLETNAFPDLPVNTDDRTNPRVENLNNLVRYRNITVSQVDELQFSVVSNSNPDLVTASIVNNQLVLDYAPNQVGTTTLVVEATNLTGETRRDEFTLNVIDGTRITGTAEADELLGNNEANRIRGLAGNDLIVGYGGRDRLSGGGGADRIFGGGGNDNIRGGSGKDTLNGSGGNDILIGNGGNDTLFGNNGNDTLRGGGGQDRLNGGRGRDILDGGGGNDTLIGGRGRDTFILRRGAGRDEIEDFRNGQDRLDARGVAFGSLTIDQQRQNTVIRVGNDTLAILQGIDADTITRADFV